MSKQEAIAKLDAFAKLFPKRLVDAVNFTALTAEAEAKRTKAFTDQTGRLRNSIMGGLVSLEGKQIVGALTAGKSDASPGGSGPFATASMLYAPFVELGTSKMSPHAFIWPAMQAIRSKRILEKAVQAQFLRSQP